MQKEYHGKAKCSKLSEDIRSGESGNTADREPISNIEFSQQAAAEKEEKAAGGAVKFENILGHSEEAREAEKDDFEEPKCIGDYIKLPETEENKKPRAWKNRQKRTVSFNLSGAGSFFRGFGSAGNKVWKGICSGMKWAVDYATDAKNRTHVALGGSLSFVTVMVFVLALNFSIGFEAIVNGKSVGIVHAESECNEVIDKLNTELATNFGEESKIAAEIVTIPRLVSKDGFTSEEEIYDAVCILSDKMCDMYSIYLGDKAVASLRTEEDAQAVLKGFKDYYTGGDDTVSFTAEKEFTIRMEKAPISQLCDVDTAVRILNGSEKQENDYVVKEGDTLWSIAAKFDTSVDDVLAINPDLGSGEEIDIGETITVKSYVPLVKVTTAQTKTYEQSIPYETETVDDPAAYQGSSEVVQEGADGRKTVTAKIIKENGHEISREVLSETVTAEPTARVKKVGSKPVPSGYGTGSFSAPTYGTITSRFGYRRSGYHKGLDIANSMGTPVRAADTGIVITAGWEGLFGNLVKINHQNGYITYYGHNSRIAVKVGQVVEKGQVIAYMGSTGNSTGPHCHFEIHKNGELVNPENYI